MTPAVEDDIEATLNITVIEAANGSTLGAFTIVPDVRYISAFNTQAEADNAVANGSWSGAGMGQNATSVEFAVQMPDDAFPSGSRHLVEVVVSGNGSINGAYDGVSTAFRFYLEDDDAAVLTSSSSTTALQSTYEGAFEVSAFLSFAPAADVTITASADASSGSNQAQKPFVIVGNPSVTGGQTLSTTGATFALQVNPLFDFEQQAQLEGSDQFDVDVTISSASSGSGFDGLETILAISVSVETVQISVRAYGESSFASANSSHIVLVEGSSSTQLIEVYTTGNVTDTVTVTFLSASSNPAFDAVPAADAVMPYVEDGIPLAFVVSPSTLIFTPGSSQTRVV